MKSKISFLFLVFIVINTYGQSHSKGNKPKPIIIYDTISVYDTLVVYDTVRVYDKSFSEKANTIGNAVLTIDTASKKTSLSLFFEKDTATLSINSILLSENTKNLDTMKKEILTMVAALMLAQTNFAQVDTIKKTSSLTINDSTNFHKKFILGVGITNNAFTRSFGGNLKFDYRINKKHRLGIRVIMAGNKTSYKDFTADERTVYINNKPDIESSMRIHPISGGHVINISLLSTFQTTNKIESGSSGLWGLGYEDSKIIETRTPASGLWSADYKKTQKVISIMGGFVLALPVGPGKIYFEYIASLGLYGVTTQNYYNQTGAFNIDPIITKTQVGLLNANVFFNLGYSLFL